MSDPTTDEGGPPWRSRWCPSCREVLFTWRLSCPRCMATLAEEDPGTVACRHCGATSPANLHSCRNCLAQLDPDPQEAEVAASDILAAGGRLWRPADWPLFRSGPSCGVIRLAAGGSLAITGPEGLVEATVASPGGRAAPPLTCRDLDQSLLFRLVTYPVADLALVALAADGAPLGTFLARGAVSDEIDVRDGTSAPVGALVPTRPHTWSFVETGGRALATLDMRDHEWDEAVDDFWTLSVADGGLPLDLLAGVAMAVAAKVLMGRREPSSKGVEDDDDRSGPDGDWVSGWRWTW